MTTGPPFLARCFGWLTGSKAIRASMRERCGPQRGSRRSRRIRQHTGDEIADARPSRVSRSRLPLHVAGEREQVSEPCAAAMRRPDRREYDRLRLVRNREEGWAILAAAQFRNPREVVLDRTRNSRSRIWVAPADCSIFDVVMLPISAPAVGLFVSSVSGFFAIWVLMHVLERFPADRSWSTASASA
jgi:hypothetical protein